MLVDFNFDSFSHGQVKSKLWLCEKLEKHFGQTFKHALVLGSWYGLLPFLILSRQSLKVRKFSLLENDSASLDISRKVLNAWTVDGFPMSFLCEDAQKVDYTSPSLSDVDLVINTSCEHMDGIDWYHQIPEGTWVALQSTNMQHPEHIFPFSSLSQFQSSFPNLELLDSALLTFEYPSKSFDRYLLLGRKAGS